MRPNMIDSPAPSVLQRLRRVLLGAPIPTSKAHHERLSPLLGLPVFSSDALSSVAYATEAILGVLVLVSMQFLHLQIWISLAIVLLIVIISISYQQTIHAYPSGGGSYIVASDNLGHGPGLVAGAALLVDYILTVAVSVAAGVAALLSAFPEIKKILPDATVSLSLLCIAVVAFANLRGLRESGKLFAIPTYGFIVSMLAVIGIGLFRIMTSPTIPPHVDSGGSMGRELQVLPWFVILRAFAAGCTALTGIEAVSNGVPAFRAPETKNAGKTLVMMSSLLSVLFLGLGYVALHMPEHYAKFSILDSSNPNYITLTAQVAAFGFGEKSAGFLCVQIFVALILILAANTAFADFPRLTSLIARDGYLPRYLSRLGDKLVFHNGIVLLAAFAGVLVVIFKGQLDALLPLYAIGVFTAFSLSQLGMVMHWRRLRTTGWRRSAAINSVGAFLCIVVLLIIAITKFKEGAWIVIVLVPIIVTMFLLVRKYYLSVSEQLDIDRFAERPAEIKFEPRAHISLLLLPRVHKGTLIALNYAMQLRGECQAVHVTLNERTLPDLQRRWQEYGQNVPLVVLPSPYRSLIQPVMEYVDKLRSENPDSLITVIVAESVSTRWYQKLLTENVAQQLKNSLARRKGVVVANVRYFLY